MSTSLDSQGSSLTMTAVKSLRIRMSRSASCLSPPVVMETEIPQSITFFGRFPEHMKNMKQQKSLMNMHIVSTIVKLIYITSLCEAGVFK